MILKKYMLSAVVTDKTMRGVKSLQSLAEGVGVTDIGSMTRKELVQAVSAKIELLKV